MENIFEKDEQQVKVIVYDTPQKVLLEYFGGEMTEEDELCGCDGKGKEYHITTKEMADNMKMSGCWGFCRGKSEIHLWHSKDVDMSELIHLLAHERGHMLNPIYKTHAKEEIKAEKYGDTARFAYDVAKNLIGQI
jgi:hypothetical protein